jgi:protein-disulfide isomerase
MNLEKWTEKWQIKSPIDVHDILIRHHNWTEQSDITYTPTFFLNGRKIPGRYGLEDIALLIPQLTEMIKGEEVFA